MVPAAINFEIYVLMTMKMRLLMSSEKNTHLEAKLAEFGFSFAEGEHIHARVAEALGDKTSFFENLKKFLDADDAAISLEFSSVLWPEFDFKAIAGTEGRLACARYRHLRPSPHDHEVTSPEEVALWSMDITEFNKNFGPLITCGQWPVSDKYFPMYEEHSFDWSKWRYGAGFCWGLFIFAAQYWD